MGAFWNFVLFVIVVLLNLVQDIGSKLRRDHIAKRTRSRATVIREGRLEELNPEQTVEGGPAEEGEQDLGETDLQQILSAVPGLATVLSVGGPVCLESSFCPFSSG